MKGKSLNKTVIRLLKKALGISDEGKKKRELSKLAGTWNRNEAAQFESAIRLFNKIDREIWEK